MSFPMSFAMSFLTSEFSIGQGGVSSFTFSTGSLGGSTLMSRDSQAGMVLLSREEFDSGGVISEILWGSMCVKALFSVRKLVVSNKHLISNFVRMGSFFRGFIWCFRIQVFGLVLSYLLDSGVPGIVRGTGGFGKASHQVV